MPSPMSAVMPAGRVEDRLQAHREQGHVLWPGLLSMDGVETARSTTMPIATSPASWRLGGRTGLAHGDRYQVDRDCD